MTKDKHSEDLLVIPLLNKKNIEMHERYDLRSYSFSISIVTTSTHNQPSRLEVDGFDKLVRDSWNVAPVNKKNAIRNFMGKLKFLKDRIRSWLSIHRSNSRGEIYFLKEELRSCDEVNNIQASEIAQKAKIKWAIEGDENVKFFSWGMTKQEAAINLIFRGRKLGNKYVTVNIRTLLDNDSSRSGVIKELFPRMFALELNKNATVSSKLNASSLDNSFRRKARSGIEEMQLNSLAEISRMTTLVPCEDRYVWTLESDRVFSMASIR
ncbi:hypothetical protein Tco_0741253, partial [Tanacetum coccineum]